MALKILKLWKLSASKDAALFVGIFQIFLKTIFRITEVSKMVTVNKIVFRITIKISYTSDFSDRYSNFSNNLKL